MAVKIADVKVGTEYGAADGSKGRWSNTLPRRVKVLEVVTEAEEYWVGSGFSSERSTRNVRKVKVEFLDEPTMSGYRLPVAAAKKGATMVLEARFLVCPWKDLRADVAARITAAQLQADTEESYVARVSALLPKPMLKRNHIYASAHVNGKVARTDMRFDGEVLDTILALAEKGAQS